MTRIIIFTGKGGVGKTSVAAAHGRFSALEGKKTLVVSTDMAHNLSDIFEMPIGRDTKEVAENLFALELDPNYIMDHDFADMKQSMINMLTSSNMPMGDLTSLSIVPGQDELFSLLKILDIYESGVYERIIVDCAPTGETLSLLKFPELMSWYMEKFFPIGKVAMGIISPISKRAFKIEMPNKAAMTDIEKLFVKLVDLQVLLKDRQVSSIRLVAIPEKMVLEETKRNYMYMNLYDFHVDGMFINRILPKDMENPFFNQWLDIQKDYIKELENVFSTIPVYKIPWFDTDLNGIEGVDKICTHTLKGHDMFKVIDNQLGETFEKTDEGYLLTINLPFLEKEDLNMHESGKDIIIKIGNFKRNIPKPNALRNHSIESAKFMDNQLKIRLT